tara:strand:- start:98 stop:331 length:234 start_codon:yes stop_codon:yes gene_type:complete
MIIGTILEIGDANGLSSNRQNGASMMMFYTEKDAVQWALSQSEAISILTLTFSVVVTVINTETGNKRWWWNGIEYTG